jgi:large subunit ribosomal protein L21e
MVKRKGGTYRKSRHLLKKNNRTKGKINLTKYFTTYTNGDKVNLVLEPAVQKARYHSRFHGKTGHVTNKRGFCYEISFTDKNKQKTIIVHPAHLKKQ